MDTPTASAGTALAGTTTAGTTTAGTATASADTAQDTKGKTPKAIRTMPASRQRSLAGRYSVSVQAVALAAFAWAFFGWLNESYLYWFENPIWLNRYTEYVIILAFGVWRISAEENIYTKKRLAVLLAVVTVLWWLIPWLIPFYEPYVGYMTSQPVFPSLHTP
ncbi:MAG: hypothetical protein OEZ04_11440, partial [Nitrospinota bacterium]|nr:hypothetical protein [Nitrospinota bacterium]